MPRCRPVTVAADLPGGLREEQTTAADGTVTFKDVPWAKGTAAVTAYLKGYRLHSHVGLTSADGDRTLYLIPHFQKPQLVAITGTAKNPDPTASVLIVSGTDAPNQCQVRDRSAKAGRKAHIAPGTRWRSELTRWTRQLPASTAPANVPFGGCFPSAEGRGMPESYRAA